MKTILIKKPSFLFLALSLCIILASGLSSCIIGTMQIEYPPASPASTPYTLSNVSSPVIIKINWTNDLRGAFKVTLDNVDISNQFTSTGSRSAVSSPQILTPGAHKIIAEGDVKSYDGFHVTSTIREFNVLTSPPVYTPPVISYITPTSGPPLSTTIEIVGTNLVAAGSLPIVRIGGTVATQNMTATATKLSCIVPGNLTGIVPVNVTSKVGEAPSNSVNFTITALPPSPLIFRSTATDIQSFNFSTSGSPSFISPTVNNLTPGTGRLTVALATDNIGQVLVRSSSQNIEAFTINTAGQVAAGSGAVSASFTSNGTSVAINSAGNQVIRSSDNNIQIFSLAGTTLTLTGVTNGTGTHSASLAVNGNAVKYALVAGRTLAVRACDNGIEIFDISVPGSITLYGKYTNGFLSSAPGAGVYVIGTTVIRTYAGGIEVYDIPTTPSTPTRLGFQTQQLHLSATGVDVISDGTFIIRATDEGIETFNFISSAGAINKIDFKNGTQSSTGVALVKSGSRVFRAYERGIEEYTISSTGMITLLTNNIIAPPATLAPTGVGIAIRR